MSDAISRLREAAHDAAARGWRVVQLHFVGPDGLTCSCNRGRACLSKGKHPINTEWQNTEPYTEADIDSLWERFPRNLGIATGEPSGIWVLDIDPDKGGTDSLISLLEGHQPLRGSTYTVRTGGGGWHFYFAMPADGQVRNSQDRLGKGIDVRGTGGQVVAPPSTTDKGAYTVVTDITPRPAPDWLLELVRPAEPKAPVYDGPVKAREDLDDEERTRLDAYSNEVIQRLISRLAALTEKGWDGEPWDATCFEVACSMLEIANSPWSAYTPADAHRDFFQAAPRDEGFDDERVEAKFSSAHKTVGGRGRPMPAAHEDDLPDLFAGVEHRGRTTVPDPEPKSDTADQVDDGGLPDPSAFFGRDGIDIDMLARVVLGMGDLGYGIDGNFWSYANGVWTQDDDVVERRVTIALRGRFRTGHAANVSAYLTHMVPRIYCNPISGFINLRNGMLRWETGELVEHDPGHLSTVQLNAEWDPDATCPQFDAFLAKVLPADYIEMAWEMLGYLMYSGNPLQIAFMFYGSGSNGKGTLIRVIQDILGEHNCAAEELDTLNSNRFAGASLFGKIANIAGDIDGTYQESTAAFKKLTGEDYYYAEEKYKRRFGFTNWAVPLFSANKIPGSADVTEGYLRRWVIFQFPHKFTGAEKVLSFSDVLAQERNGIVAKAMPALRRLLERGEFELRGDALRAKTDFAEHIDQVRQWLADATIEAPEHFEARQRLYQSYTTWAASGGGGRLKDREFYHRLESIGFEPRKRKGIRGFIGVAPMTPDPAPVTSFFQEVDA